MRSRRESVTRNLGSAIAVLSAMASAALPSQVNAQATAQAPMPGESQLAQSATPIAFEIPAGPLPAALSAFGERTGLQLLYPADVARGLVSPGVSGLMTPADALRRLLGGTGLLYRFTNASTVTVERPGAVAPGTIQLDPLHVAGGGQAADQSARSYVTSQATTATKTVTPLIEEPQTVNVVTAGQMKSQGAQSINDAVRYTPGVTGDFYGGATYGDFLKIRGFDAQQYLDGTRSPYGLRGYAQVRAEPFGLDRLEVLKGPASVMYGQNAPGGIINYVRKKPTTTPINEVQGQVGNYNRFQGAFDLGGALDEQNEFLYRITGLARSSGTQVDFVRDDRIFIAPAFTWRPSAQTSVTVLASYQKDFSGNSPLPAQGSLMFNPNGRLPTNTNLGYSNYDGFLREQFVVGYDLEHRFDDVWSVRQKVNYVNVFMDYKYVFLSGLQANQRTMNRALWNSRDTATSLSIDNNVLAKFNTGAVEHNVLLGLDYNRLGFDSYFGSTAAGTVDIYNPTQANRPANPNLLPDQNQTQNLVGVYMQDQVRWNGFTLTGSLRNDWVDGKSFNWNTLATTYQNDSKVTGRAGLTYVSEIGLAPYVGFSTSFDPVAGSDALGNPFQPTTGQQIEAGLRYQPKGFESYITLSFYDLTQQNVLTPNPILPGFFVQTGQVNVQGIEIEAKANLWSTLNVIASYAYTKSKVTQTNTPLQLGKEFVRTPNDQAALWLDYTVPNGTFAGLGFGAGVRYIGQTYGNLNNTIIVPSYTLFDAMLRYDLGQLGPKLEGLNFRLNATNLTDQVYIASCSSLTSANCYYGNRLAVYGTLSYQW